jgi:Glycosyltransferase family 87
MYPRAVLGVVLIVLVAGTFIGNGTNTTTGRLGGDFPSFYAAGSIVADGHGDRLYDPALQAEVQEGLFGEEAGFLYFSYPPYYAYPYAPLSFLPFRVAFLIHALLSVAALGLAVRLAAPLLPRLLSTTDLQIAAVAVLLLAYPMLRSVLGGQNTAFTLLLLVGAWRLASGGNDLGAGLALAALLYKPQFALPLLGLVIVARRWRIVMYWALGAAALYLSGAAMLGWGWVGGWLDQVSRFNETNIEVNGHLMVSAVGWWQNLVNGPVALVLATPFVIAAAATGALVWWRRGVSPVAVAIAAPVIVITAPSALYYDAALALLAFGVALDRELRAAWYALAAFIAVSYTQLAGARLGWSPLFPLLVVTLVWGVVTYSPVGEDPGVTPV